MLDQVHSSSDQFSSPTGLRVRQDLYDEDYSDEDYEQMLSMYEGTMSQIVPVSNTTSPDSTSAR